jgi:hypothetical protein
MDLADERFFESRLELRYSPFSTSFAHDRLRATRQTYRELAVFANLAVHSDGAAMLLRHDVVGDRQAEAGAFAGRFGGEERLEQFVLDVVGNTCAASEASRVVTFSVGMNPASAPFRARLVAA